jgi:hypothetical protein
MNDYSRHHDQDEKAGYGNDHCFTHITAGHALNAKNCAVRHIFTAAAEVKK